MLRLAQLLVAQPLERIRTGATPRMIPSECTRTVYHPTRRLGWVVLIGRFLAFKRVGRLSSPEAA